MSLLQVKKIHGEAKGKFGASLAMIRMTSTSDGTYAYVARVDGNPPCSTEMHFFESVPYCT